MKKIITLIALLLITSSSYAFYINTNVYFFGNYAHAVVQNYYDRPIVCSGHLRALDSNGIYSYTYINFAVMRPGQFVYLNATAMGYGNYFRDATVNMNCDWH
ncbi:MAG: hypothetical protein KAG61_00430 [Bacteriovoracaceae bacterium]|nr:hypothetical protein [Bacteriovoracaceae bacterium]